MEEKFNLNSCRFVQEMITPTEGFGNDGNGEGGHHGCLVPLGQDEGREDVEEDEYPHPLRPDAYI